MPGVWRYWTSYCQQKIWIGGECCLWAHYLTFLHITITVTRWNIKQYLRVLFKDSTNYLMSTLWERFWLILSPIWPLTLAMGMARLSVKIIFTQSLATCTSRVWPLGHGQTTLTLAAYLEHFHNFNPQRAHARGVTVVSCCVCVLLTDLGDSVVSTLKKQMTKWHFIAFIQKKLDLFLALSRLMSCAKCHVLQALDQLTRCKRAYVCILCLLWYGYMSRDLAGIHPGIVCHCIWASLVQNI